VAVAPGLSVFGELAAIRLIRIPVFMAIWLSHLSIFGKLFLLNLSVAVAPWLSLFDELVAIQLTLCKCMAMAKPHPHIFGAVLTESLCGCGTLVNSVRWTSSYTADSCPCIFSYRPCGCSYEIYVWLLCAAAGVRQLRY
jgi:hypothetical protein